MTCILFREFMINIVTLHRTYQVVKCSGLAHRKALFYKFVILALSPIVGRQASWQPTMGYDEIASFRNNP
jgi:hypothetical protein